MGTHRYSRNPDHIRRRNVPAPDNQAMSEHLQKLLSPMVYNQQAYYRSLGSQRPNLNAAVDGRSRSDLGVASGPLSDRVNPNAQS